MIKELESRFGTASEEQKKWVAENLGNLEEEQKEIFLRELNKSNNGKFPDIALMKSLMVRITGKRPKEYIWAVCLECGCEYDYELPMCPACYDKGLECRARAVKKSEFQPPMKVVRYNKTFYKFDKEQNCYSCVHKKESYCPHFGNPNWTCKREEAEMCNCRTCCASLSHIQRKTDEQKTKEVKTSYAIPLKKV